MNTRLLLFRVLYFEASAVYGITLTAALCIPQRRRNVERGGTDEKGRRLKEE